MKLSPVWLFCLLPLSGIALAAPDPLLKVVVATPTTQNNSNSNSNSCTLDGNGQVIIEHTVKLFPTGSSLKSKEVRVASFNVNTIKGVIANAARGKITGTPLEAGYKHQYFAFQNTKPVFLMDKVGGGLVNNSPTVQPLTKFIDSVCGDLSLVAYQDSARAKFSDVILSTAGVKTAIDVCAQANAGFGNAGSAGACDGLPFGGDSNVVAALDQVNKMIAATPPADAKVASVTISNVSPTNVTITATATVLGGLQGETYVLSGTYNPSGFVVWTVSPFSTCKVTGIC